MSTRTACLSALLACLALSGCGGDDIRKALGMGKNPPDEFAVVGRAPLSIPPDYTLRPPMPGQPRPQEQSPQLAAKAAVLGGNPAAGTTQTAPTPRPANNPQTASVTPVTDPPPPTSAPRTPVASGSLGGATPPVTSAAYVTSGILGPRSSSAQTQAPANATPAPAASTPAPAAADPKTNGEQALLNRLGADKSLPNIRSVLTEELTKLAEANETTIDQLLWWKKPAAPAKVLDASKENQRLQENAALGKPATEGESPSIKRVNKSFVESLF